MLNANDLKNISESIEDRLQKRSERKGKELANKIIDDTANGRGLWIFILWPTFIALVIFIGAAFNAFLEINMFVSFILGTALSYAWYRSDFTILHPLWSSVLVVGGFFFFIILLR